MDSGFHPDKHRAVALSVIVETRIKNMAEFSNLSRSCSRKRRIKYFEYCSMGHVRTVECDARTLLASGIFGCDIVPCDNLFLFWKFLFYVLLYVLPVRAQAL